MDSWKFEEKVGRAIKVLNEALTIQDGTFVIYLADMPGLVLLHLLKQVGDGRISLPVLNIQFQPMHRESFCFVEKLKRMWGLKLDIERLPLKPEGVGYTEVEILEITSHALKRRGALRAVSSHLDEFVGGGYSFTRHGYQEFRPLYSFSEYDILEYADKRRIPLCSLEKKADGVQVAIRNESSEDAMLREKLKSLGYL